MGFRNAVVGRGPLLEVFSAGCGIRFVTAGREDVGRRVGCSFFVRALCSRRRTEDRKKGWAA